MSYFLRQLISSFNIFATLLKKVSAKSQKTFYKPVIVYFTQSMHRHRFERYVLHEMKHKKSESMKQYIDNIKVPVIKNIKF